MSELLELLEQKKQIEERIKQLKNMEICAERSKLSHKHYSGCRVDEWTVSIQCQHLEDERVNRWFPAIYGVNKEEVIKDLEKLIADLQRLQEKMVKE